jgi:hypothetical protein
LSQQRVHKIAEFCGKNLDLVLDVDLDLDVDHPLEGVQLQLFGL